MRELREDIINERRVRSAAAAGRVPAGRLPGAWMGGTGAGADKGAERTGTALDMFAQSSVRDATVCGAGDWFPGFADGPVGGGGGGGGRLGSAQGRAGVSVTEQQQGGVAGGAIFPIFPGGSASTVGLFGGGLRDGGGGGLMTGMTGPRHQHALAPLTGAGGAERRKSAQPPPPGMLTTTAASSATAAAYRVEVGRCTFNPC
jgi:hypothetical protein